MVLDAAWAPVFAGVLGGAIAVAGQTSTAWIARKQHDAQREEDRDKEKGAEKESAIAKIVAYQAALATFDAEYDIWTTPGERNEQGEGRPLDWGARPIVAPDVLAGALSGLHTLAALRLVHDPVGVSMVRRSMVKRAGEIHPGPSKETVTLLTGIVDDALQPLTGGPRRSRLRSTGARSDR